ncbi:MAG: hypothetical protein ABMB14_08870 [Myxococcota bacterium]
MAGTTRWLGWWIAGFAAAGCGVFGGPGGGDADDDPLQASDAPGSDGDGSGDGDGGDGGGGHGGGNGGGNGGTSGTADVPRCGDGVVDPALDEVCDDGNPIDGDGCNVDCDVSGRVLVEDTFDGFLPYDQPHGLAATVDGIAAVLLSDADRGVRLVPLDGGRPIDVALGASRSPSDVVPDPDGGGFLVAATERGRLALLAVDLQGAVTEVFDVPYADTAAPLRVVPPDRVFAIPYARPFDRGALVGATGAEQQFDDDVVGATHADRDGEIAVIRAPAGDLVTVEPVGAGALLEAPMPWGDDYADPSVDRDADGATIVAWDNLLADDPVRVYDRRGQAIGARDVDDAFDAFDVCGVALVGDGTGDAIVVQIDDGVTRTERWSGDLLTLRWAHQSIDDATYAGCGSLGVGPEGVVVVTDRYPRIDVVVLAP